MNVYWIWQIDFTGEKKCESIEFLKVAVNFFWNKTLSFRNAETKPFTSETLKCFCIDISRTSLLSSQFAVEYFH